MGRNIKINEHQYRLIQEALDDTFTYADGDDDTKPFDGLVNISASGKENGQQNAKEPVVTDKIANSLSPQEFAKFGLYGYSRRVPTVVEGVSIDDEEHSHNVGNGLNALTNDTEDDDLSVIPNTILQRMNNLCSLIKEKNLPPRKQAMLLNLFIDKLDVASIPFSWKKALIRRINTK